MPYLIAFAKAMFGAQKMMRLAALGGRTDHPELRIGDSAIMLADANPEQPAMQCMLMVYVDDADATDERALSGSATAMRPVAIRLYGDRTARSGAPAKTFVVRGPAAVEKAEVLVTC